MTSQLVVARLVVGVMGHVDHGKTALVRALTGIETDRLPEERRRGISIALGFAHLAEHGIVLDLIDMPGHERFVRTMVSGATGIDVVMLVVAGNEGLKPQTVEHVDVAGLLGVGRAVVVVTKADLIDAVRAYEVAQAATQLCVSRGMRVEACVTVSTPAGVGLGALRQALTGLTAGSAPARDRGSPFLPIDRVFSIDGHGTVVTGTLRGGALAAGDTVALVPGGPEARVRTLQVHSERVLSAAAGQRVAVNLRGMEASAIRPGLALAAPGHLTGSCWLSISLATTADAPPLRTTARVRLLAGTQEVDARLRLLDRDVLQPGQRALVQVHCAEPVAIPAREHVILRLASPAVTVAGGQVLDTGASRLRRRDSDVLAHLRMLADASPDVVVVTVVDTAGMSGTSLPRLTAVSGLGPAAVVRALDGRAAILRGGDVVSIAGLAAASDAITAQLRSDPAALGRHASLPGIGTSVFEEAVRRLTAAGTVRLSDGAITLASHDQDTRRAAEAAALEHRLAAAVLAGALAPPDEASLVQDVPTRRALAALVRAGILVRATDRVQRRDVLFHRDAVVAARRVLSASLGPGGMTVSEAGAALGISRKFSVPLLEHLDAVQFTRRIGDRRVLARQ